MEVEAGLLADQVAAKEGSLSVDAVPERALIAFTKGVIVIEFAVASLEIDLKKVRRDSNLCVSNMVYETQ